MIFRNEMLNNKNNNDKLNDFVFKLSSIDKISLKGGYEYYLSVSYNEV